MKLIFILIALTAFNSQAKTLKVMSFNAHNLFDTKHDEGKNDWAYTAKDTPGKIEACNAMTNPRYKKSCLKGDWNDEKLELKLNQLAKVITHNGTPDILGLVEVENYNVTQLLADKIGLKRVEITHGPDKRGIETALLFNETDLVKHIKTIEHEVKGHDHLKDKPTRNILEVILEINGEKVSIFVNHWPSQSNPSSVRVLAAKKVKSVINKRAILNRKHKFIVLGDFNVILKDYPHAFKSVLLNYKDKREKKSKKGLKDFFKVRELLDAHTVFMNDRNASYKVKNSFPKGTYFFKRDMTWNLLDRIFYSDNLVDAEASLQVDPLSYRIHTPSFTKTVTSYTKKDDYAFGTVINGIPFKSNHNATKALNAGYSDHFGVIIELKLK